MCQLEILGASSLLKLLVSDLWTSLWTVMAIETLGPSLTLKLLVTDHSVRQLEVQDEVQF